MKQLVLLCVLLLASGCGQPTSNSCKVIRGPNYVKVDCPDGTSAIVLDGAPGTDGVSPVFASFSAVGCPNGGTGILAGLDTNHNSSLENSEVTAAAFACNGVDGQDALPGLFNGVSILDPCGDAPGVVDEVMLKLSDASVLSSFSSNLAGANTRFSLLPPGSYETSDGSACFFTLNSDGSLSNEHY